jgi:hypothetical protein
MPQKCKFCGEPIPENNKEMIYCSIICKRKQYYQNHRTELIERQKKYKKENKEKLRIAKKEYDKKYYRNHKEEITSYHKKYWDENAERLKEYNIKLYLKNKESFQNSQKRYQKKHHAKLREKRREKYIEYKKMLENLPEDERNKIKENVLKYAKDYRNKNKAEVKKRVIEYQKKNPGKIRETIYLSKIGISKKDITMELKQFFALLRLGRRISGVAGCTPIDKHKIKDKLEAIKKGDTHEAYE